MGMNKLTELSDDALIASLERLCADERSLRERMLRILGEVEERCAGEEEEEDAAAG